LTTFTTEDREDAERNLIHENAPVAWMYERPNGSAKLTFVREPMAGTVVKEFPLYTHPAKTLTDEEIKFIAHPFESVYTTYDKQADTDTVHTRFDQLGFAKAILRKAQEK
jgi:hypothetical protein